MSDPDTVARRFVQDTSSRLFGKEVSRDVIGHLRALHFVAQPVARRALYVLAQFLSHLGFETPRDLPDMEQLDDGRFAQQAEAARRRTSA